MHHIAIMKKEWGLIDKIRAGEKTIESRWYKFRRDPWNKIEPGDIIYFKNSGGPVELSAKVSKVLQFDTLDEKKIREILGKYGKAICLSGKIDDLVAGFVGKKYCILMYLTDVENVEPFCINKKGFGISAAWLAIEDVGTIKKVLLI